MPQQQQEQEDDKSRWGAAGRMQNNEEECRRDASQAIASDPRAMLGLLVSPQRRIQGSQMSKEMGEIRTNWRQSQRLLSWAEKPNPE